MKPRQVTPPILSADRGDFRLLAAVLGLVLLAGCPQSGETPEAEPAKRPLEGVKLSLAVVDDPALAAAILRQRGEWNVQTGAEFDVVETTAEALTSAETLPADAVVCASHLLGVLAERGRLAAVPAETLVSPDWGGVFELLRVREDVWANQTMAVPFGSPVLCCYYRADLLKKHGRRPPQTWSEYEELAKLLATDKPADGGAWSGVVEPLAPGWAGLTLLARAACYAKHRDNYSSLFSMETMEPMVAGPPFVQALEDLVAAAKHGPTDPFQYDPAAARKAFQNGQCGMTLSWPTAAEEKGERGEGREERGSALSQVGFVELPGSKRVFNLNGGVWDRRNEDDDTRTPLLSIAGRIGVVSKATGQVEAAFRLLLWLSDNRTSPQVSPASSATTLFRASQVKSPGVWVEKSMPAAAAFEYAEATEAALRHEQWLGALRLPGRAEYLAALDEAVAAAVRGEKAPLDALREADAQWRKITESLGLEKQKAAYRHSLGLP